MTSYNHESSLRGAALVAGFGLFLMILFVLLAAMVETRITPGDAAATASNILSHEGSFRLGIACYVIVVVLDIVLAWALYVFLKPANKNLSLLAGWLRLAYAVIFGVALYHFFNALELLRGAEYLSAFKPDQLQALALLSTRAFGLTWDIGYVFFGLHLGLVGILSFTSGYVPKILGILLVVAGLGYLAETVITFFLPDFSVPIAMVTFAGEVIFAVWLLVKGIRGFDVQATQ